MFENTAEAGEARGTQTPELVEEEVSPMSGKVCDLCKRYGKECEWPRDKVTCKACQRRRQKCKINGAGVEDTWQKAREISGTAELRVVEKELREVGVARREVHDALRELAAEVLQPGVGEATEPDEPEYEVAEIVDCRLDDAHELCPLHYLVRWAGFEGTDEEYSWVPLIDLGNAKEAIMDFHSRNPSRRSALPMW